MTNLITVHFGSRQPKRYYTEIELAKMGREVEKDGVLHPDQPEGVKCRLKMRFPADMKPRQMLPHLEEHWARQDHAAEPVWATSDDNNVTAIALAALLGISEIREWAPEEGDH